MARAAHAPPQDTTLQPPKAIRTPGHPARQRYGTWPSRAAQSLKNTLARGCHTLVTAELSGRRRQHLNQRTTMSTEKGSVSTGGLWNGADLAFKEWKNWNPSKLFASHRNDGISSSNASLKCFPANRKKLKGYTNLHSPNGLGEHNLPPEQVRGTQNSKQP